MNLETQHVKEKIFLWTRNGEKKIVMNLPIELGYCILQYWKFRMLVFKYLHVYVDLLDYTLSEMDTDSNYFWR